MFSFEDFNLTNTSFNNIFIGVVENNNDPLQQGRCQIRILGLHTEQKNKSNVEGIPTEELPWAIAANPLLGGSISGLGINGVPVKGSWIVGFFIGGNHNYPVIFASISSYASSAPDTTKGFNDPDGVYPNLLNQPDWNKYARGSKVDHGTVLGSEPSNPSNPTYPNNDVQQNKGIIVECDGTPGAERWCITHIPTKSYIQIGPNGDIVVKSQNKEYLIANDKVTIEGKEVDINGLNGTGINKGCVQGDCICSFTGMPHPMVSATVKVSL